MYEPISNYTVTLRLSVRFRFAYL